MTSALEAKWELEKLELLQARPARLLRKGRADGLGGTIPPLPTSVSAADLGSVMEGAEALSQPRASHPKVAKNFKAASGGGGPSDAPDRLLKVLTTASQKAMVGVGERLEEKRKAAHEARYSLTPVITSKQKDVRGLSGSQSMAELSRSMPTGVGLAAKGLDAVRTPVQGAIRPRTTNLTTRDQQHRPSFADRPRTVGDGVGRSPRDSGHSGGQVYKVRYREMVQPERLPTPGARSITPLSTPGTTKPTTPASGASPRAGTTSPPRDGSPPQKWSESTHNAFESHYAPRKLQAGAAVLSVSRAGPTRASTPAAASTQGDEPPFIDMSFVYKPDRVTVKNALAPASRHGRHRSLDPRPPSQQQLGWGAATEPRVGSYNSPPQPLNMGATNRPWSGYSEGPCAVSGMAMTMEASLRLHPPATGQRSSIRMMIRRGDRRRPRRPPHALRRCASSGKAPARHGASGRKAAAAQLAAIALAGADSAGAADALVHAGQAVYGLRRGGRGRGAGRCGAEEGPAVYYSR